jgi:hypothetical protein
MGKRAKIFIFREKKLASQFLKAIPSAYQTKLLLMKIKLVSFFSIGLLMLGCATPFQYVGKSYPATNQIDIYFSTKDVKKAFEVMGTINGPVSQSADFNQTMEKVKKEARKQGADAVIIEGIELIPNNPADTVATEKGGNLVSESLINSHYKMTYGGPANRAYDELKGQLIKYK